MNSIPAQDVKRRGIVAKDIERWAQGSAARGDLPGLIRRLAVLAGSVTEIAFPAGDSVTRPGWDGRILSQVGDPWVPAGLSLWELSVESKVTTKANSDYEKRTQETDLDTRKESTLVIVTARHWAKKEDWVSKKRAQGEWQSVRAYDADDLEAWLEASPAIALAFAEELGIAGNGVESLSRSWQIWATQCEPRISSAAFLAYRQEAIGRLTADLRARIASGPRGTYTIRADSVAEATAFVCAVLVETGDLSDLALVVTDEAGWRFVECNPRLRLAIAARPEVAWRPAANVLTVIPVAAGDLASGYGGNQGERVHLELKRPSIYAFRDALIAIGVEESDARRLALATGRSWSVYRRRRATNPAIRSPEWLNLPEADALTTLCLLGAWHGEKAADRAIVEQLAGESYEAIERKLRKLAAVDDAPAISIGKVWRAKAPLELLDLFADRIATAALDRFFAIVESLLVDPDPILELEPDQRWMAQVYGKVRGESGLLFRSVCDALVKLAVRGRAYEGLTALNVDIRVERLVERLLDGADATRWLSLASHLSPLAEAAPGAFIKALERSLGKPDVPVLTLFTESASANNPICGGAWFYADLLWALELLAWSPRWMPRAALLLARMCHVQLPDNWSNRPLNSLLGIFRSWMPQTAATLEQRIAVLDKLMLLDPPRTDQAIAIVAAFAAPDASDSDRELIRNELREQLHWHLSYGNRHPETDLGSEMIARWRELYEALSPVDPVVRHRWLFQNGWVDLPMQALADYRQEDQRREEWRLSALREVHRELGVEGVLRVADLSGDASIVGRCLLDVVPEPAALADWILDLETDFSLGAPRTSMICGILRFLPVAETAPFLDRVIQLGRERDWAPERLATFLRLARAERLTWSLAETCGEAVDAAYWRMVSPSLWHADAAEREFETTKFLEAERPISALNAMMYHLEDSSPALLLKALDAALTHGEADAKFPDAWHLEKVVNRLEAWDGMDQERLLQIEFQLVPAFRFPGTCSLKVLTEAITSRPELFAELVCLIWRPEHDEPRAESEASSGERMAAENAWRLLHDYRRQPGTLDHGEIDADACIGFVDRALDLCRARDRSTLGEQTIGGILAHAPIGEDGLWPGFPARDILDRAELSQMRTGFEVGTFNKRGVTSRAMDEGGIQERDLADQCRRNATGLAASHPHLAESLERIARGYECDAKRHDDDAALN